MKETKKNLVDKNYSEILKLVKEGWNISNAIEKFGINRATFYKNISEYQKQEIYTAKKLHTKFGVGYWYRYK
jgi:ACT domain-containing protein